MPRLVDRDERREQVVAATCRVIARSGLAAASVREIARESGCSTGVIAHYFRDKDDLLMSALERVARQENSRIRTRVAGRLGLEALRLSLHEVMPAGDEGFAEMTVWMHFWSRALASEAMTALQRRHYSEWRAVLRAHLEEAHRRGELRPDVEIEDEVEAMVALTDGLSLQAVLEPEHSDHARRTAIVDRWVDGLRRRRGALAGRAAAG